MTTTPAQPYDVSRRSSSADHPGRIRAYLPFWDTQYRPDLLKTIAAIPADRFDFKPQPEMFTAHQVVVHIADNEHNWMSNLIEGRPWEPWLAPHEDPGQGWVTMVSLPDHGALLSALEKAHRSTQSWLDKPGSELSRAITWRGDGGAERRCTLHWILDGLQEHDIHHRAQLNLYLRLMGIEPPGI
jgi:uncharacterized damage-inducible protein DinB